MMLRRAALLCALGVAGYIAGASIGGGGAPPAASAAVDEGAWFRLRATVVRVIDGDTLVAQVGTRSERVRLIGIDAPELPSDCYAQQATAAARRQAARGAKVVLVGDRSQSRRDRYGRLLAYVQLKHVAARETDDLGELLIYRGYAQVYVYDQPFARLRDYRLDEESATHGPRGLWAACKPTTTTTTTTTTTITAITTTTTTTDRSGCDPSYPTVCIPPPPPDLDCGDIRFADFRVDWSAPNPDPHRFDGDHDGIGCET